MNVAQMRRADAWLGGPAVRLLAAHARALGGPPPAPAERPRKILFVKLAEQGSTVLAQHALRDAAARVGRDNLYFLLFAENRPVLDLLDLVPAANVIAIPTGNLLSAARGALAAVRRLRRERVDAAIDLEFFARSSAVLAYLTGARWRVGFHAYHGEAADRGGLLTHRVTFNPHLHTSRAFRLLVSALDAPAAALPTYDLAPPPLAELPGRYEPTPAEHAHAGRLLEEAFGPGPAGRRVVLLNANASDLVPLRRWEPTRYVDLARRLLARYPESVVAFTGAPSEREAAGRLAAEVGSPRAASVAGRTTLRELLALYHRAEVLVTNDSGPAHFATLTPVDVVVLFGPETPALFAAPSPRTHALWAGLACSPCVSAYNDRRSACRDAACMRRLDADGVFAAVCAAYDARRPGRVPLPRAA